MTTTTTRDNRTAGVRRPPRSPRRPPRRRNSPSTNNLCDRTRSGQRTERSWTCRLRGRNRKPSMTACRSSGMVSNTICPGTTTRNSRTARVTRALAASVTLTRSVSDEWSTITQPLARDSYTVRTTGTWDSTPNHMIHVRCNRLSSPLSRSRRRLG